MKSLTYIPQQMLPHPKGARHILQFDRFLVLNGGQAKIVSEEIFAQLEAHTSYPKLVDCGALLVEDIDAKPMQSAASVRRLTAKEQIKAINKMRDPKAIQAILRTDKRETVKAAAHGKLRELREAEKAAELAAQLEAEKSTKKPEPEAEG